MFYLVFIHGILKSTGQFPIIYQPAAKIRPCITKIKKILTNRNYTFYAYRQTPMDLILGKLLHSLRPSAIISGNIGCPIYIWNYFSPGMAVPPCRICGEAYFIYAATGNLRRTQPSGKKTIYG
jgi:hypothetical protein